jgi:transcriptional regulator with XRE-family HTH domain
MVSEGCLFRVEAYRGESLGHFLGRFRRANALSHKSLAEHLSIRVEWIIAWESPSRRRNPTPLQLFALSKLVEVEPHDLAEMLPPEPLELKILGTNSGASVNAVAISLSNMLSPCEERQSGADHIEKG